MTPQQYELAYAAAWRSLAASEGHCKKLPVQQVKQSKAGRTKQSVFDFVKAGMTNTVAIAAMLCVNDRTVRRYMYELASAGMVHKVGNQWRVK